MEACYFFVDGEAREQRGSVAFLHTQTCLYKLPDSSRSFPSKSSCKALTSEKQRRDNDASTRHHPHMWKWLRAWLLGALGTAELVLSAVVHLGYGFYIFIAAVTADVSMSLVEGLLGCSNGGIAKGRVVEVEDEAAVLNRAMLPIVLVHGIFRLRQRRMCPPFFVMIT
jgi:hypothetical protein